MKKETKAKRRNISFSGENLEIYYFLEEVPNISNYVCDAIRFYRDYNENQEELLNEEKLQAMIDETVKEVLNKDFTREDLVVTDNTLEDDKGSEVVEDNINENDLNSSEEAIKEEKDEEDINNIKKDTGVSNIKRANPIRSNIISNLIDGK